MLILSAFVFQSCRKNFGFDEFSNLTTDSLEFDGSLAIPILDTKFTLESFIPETDSSIWAEVDAQSLIHIRMYFKDVISLRMGQIYPITSSGAPSGTPIPAGETSVRTDTSQLKVFSRMLEGKLFFNDPKITFIISNQIPVVTFFRLDTLIFHDVEGQSLSNTSDKEYTISAPSTWGEVSTTNILIDKNEIPVLPDVFSPVPKQVSFYMSFGSNALQTLPFDVTGDEILKLDADFDLPLDARLEDLVMGDTMNMDFSKGTFSQITSAVLKVRFTNGFPLEGRTQIYFADTTATGEINNIVDSLFDELNTDVFADGWRFVSAITNTSGVVTETSVSNIYIEITQEKFQKLKDARVAKILLLSKLNTYNSTSGTFIKLLSTYQLGVELGMKANYIITGEDF